MKHKRLFFSFCAAVLYALPFHAQSDSVRYIREAQNAERTEVSEQSFPLKETAEMKKKPDSLVRVEKTTVLFFTDTLTIVVSSPDSLQKQREDTIRTDSLDRRGHYIEAHIGASFGTLGYGFTDNQSRVDGFVSGLAQLQYAYFFHQNVGVGIGAWFTNATSTAHLGGTYTWEDQEDTDLEQHYTHTSQVVEWDERQNILNIGIPVSLQFQWLNEKRSAGLFAAVGLAPSFAVANSYKVMKGTINHSGYYPAWNLTLTDIHEFGNKDYTTEQNAKGSLEVKPQVTVFADLGALIPLTKQIDFFVGGYFQCGANDANKSEKHDIGWKDENFSFMENYTGAYALNSTKSSHPYEVGLKLGVHWHHIKPDKHTTVDYFDYFTRRDTTIQLLTRQDTVVTDRIDTLTRSHILKAAEEVEKFNKIYFDYDSYKLSNEAQNYLSSIVNVLNKVPDAKVSIDGHASAEGQVKHNEKLAYNRAKSVAKFLVSKGLDKKRVIVIGHGSLISNEENINHELPLDRRVEVKVVQKQSDIQK